MTEVGLRGLDLPRRKTVGLVQSRFALTLASIGIVLVAWVVVNRYTPYLPPLSDVADEIGGLLSEPRELVTVIGTTLWRLVIGVSLAYSAAVMTALLMRRNEWWEGFLSPYVLAMTATPSLVAALLSVMVFGFSEVGVYVATAVVLFPYILLSLSEGFGSLDRQLREMSVAYRLTSWQYYRHVALPELTPHLYAALRSAHALGWKIVVLVEVFGSGSGIGHQYKRAYDLFDLPLLVAWVVFFLATVWLVEYGLLRPIGARLVRWRTQ
jgi:NitT/TauT family transport system permease protein